MLPPLLQRIWRRLDRRIEKLVLGQVTTKAAPSLILSISGCLLLATVLRRMLIGRLEVDIFFVAIIAACFFFRQRGMWTMAPALPLYHWSGSARPIGFTNMLMEDVLELVEWTFLAMITTISLNKYGDSKRYEDRMRTDMSLAKTLQRTMMPPIFESRRVRIQAVIHQSLEVGGDFYYFRPFKEKYIIFCLGDIMGKGVSAAMVMAIVLGFFYEWGKLSFSPSFIMARLNERLLSVWGDPAAGSDSSWFSTLFYSIYDEESRELIFSSGGHQAAILLRKAGTVEYLKTDGIPLGLFETDDWQEQSVVLEPGDRVIVFTDGVNEARDARGEIFTMDRVVAKLLELRNRRSDALVHGLLEAVRQFSEGVDGGDDMAIIVMEVTA